MNRANKILNISIRLATSLTSTRQLGLHSLALTQVNRFSLLTQSPPFSPDVKPQTYFNHSNLHQNAFFSSKPEPGSFVDVILSSDWSEETEIELEKLIPELTHESVVYALMKLIGNPKKSLDFWKWVCVRKGFDPSFVPYGLMLKCLACKDFVEEFWVIASEMQEKGFVIDNRLYFNVLSNLRKHNLDKAITDWIKFYKNMCGVAAGNEEVNYVLELIKGSDWSEEVEGKLEKKLEFPLSEYFVFRVLGELWETPLKALKFFKWVSSCGGYEHNSVTYNAMLRVLGKPGSVQEFWELLDEMKSEGFGVDYDSFIKMLRTLPIGDAVKLFETMMDGPYKPSLPECILLLRNITRESDPDMELANRVVNRCVAEGNVLTKQVYDGMHRILCKIGKFDEAKEIIQQMRDAGYEPDNITYSQEVFGLCSQKRFEEACNLLDQMEAEGCVPDIKTWTILIQGYCTADQVDEALNCLLKMKDKNVEPDAETLEVLIYGFLSKNKVVGAFKFLIGMVDKYSIKPWQSTYKLMIEKLAEDGKLEEAFQLLSMMKKHDHPAYPNPIVEYISESGTVDDAKKLLSLLSSKKTQTPTSAAYVRVIRAFFEKGRVSEAQDLLYSSPYHVRTLSEIRNLFGWGQAKFPRQERGTRPKQEVAFIEE
ncbi:pentatricopeptide repeat-containing protein At3g48250, chloroplastic-like [Silene latifolia]|uniref:pentatricopeptide repeat-containing protein At3g48250, chloroplastic-like n=1 Tax=Silene latifolia TaxID=37657 RepID=UPI003D7713E9